MQSQQTGCYASVCVCTGKGSSARVGDGGASWRLKALARAKQQTADASNPNYGRRVGDIVSEQWGSLAELTAGLTDTRAAHGAALDCSTPITPCSSLAIYQSKRISC